MTQAPTVDTDLLAGLETIAAFDPKAHEALEASWIVVQGAIDSELLSALRERIESLLEQREESAPPPERFSAEIAVADQFVDYVPDLDDELLAPLREKYSQRELRELMDAMYILDQAARLRITYNALNLSTDGPGRITSVDAALDDVFKEADESEVSPVNAALQGVGSGKNPARANMYWHDLILTTNPLGTFTRELVRLRAARYHHCRVCNSTRVVDENGVRVVSAELEQVLEDPTTTMLGDEQKAALRYAEVYMADPLSIDAALAAELRRNFSDGQILQLTLEVSSWNLQKVLVALKIDKPVSEEGLTATMRDEKTGRAVLGGLLTS